MNFIPKSILDILTNKMKELFSSYYANTKSLEGLVLEESKSNMTTINNEIKKMLNENSSHVITDSEINELLNEITLDIMNCSLNSEEAKQRASIFLYDYLRFQLTLSDKMIIGKINKSLSNQEDINTKLSAFESNFKEAVNDYKTIENNKSFPYIYLSDNYINTIVPTDDVLEHYLNTSENDYDYYLFISVHNASNSIIQKLSFNELNIYGKEGSYEEMAATSKYDIELIIPPNTNRVIGLGLKYVDDCEFDLSEKIFPSVVLIQGLLSIQSNHGTIKDSYFRVILRNRSDSKNDNEYFIYDSIISPNRKDF